MVIFLSIEKAVDDLASGVKAGRPSDMEAALGDGKAGAGFVDEIATISNLSGCVHCRIPFKFWFKRGRAPSAAEGVL
jgi:hypothetical protein